MKKLKLVVAVIAIAVLAIVMVAFLAYRFANPHLTETELTIYFLREYWWTLPIVIWMQICIKINL